MEGLWRGRCLQIFRQGWTLFSKSNLSIYPSFRIKIKLSFAAKREFIIPISLELDGVNLWDLKRIIWSNRIFNEIWKVYEPELQKIGIWKLEFVAIPNSFTLILNGFIFNIEQISNSNSLISYLCKLMVNINILNTKGLQH